MEIGIYFWGTTANDTHHCGLPIPETAGSTFQFILKNSFGLSACPTNYTKKKIFRQDDSAGDELGSRTLTC